MALNFVEKIKDSCDGPMLVGEVSLTAVCLAAFGSLVAFGHGELETLVMVGTFVLGALGAAASIVLASDILREQ